MMWNGDGSWGWWLPGLFVFLMCMLMMARMMSHGGHHGHGSTATPTQERGADRPEGAERILADRLARGEIDIDEYERRLAVLHRSRQPERP